MSECGLGAPTSDNYECSDEHVCLYGGHVGRGATFSTATPYPAFAPWGSTTGRAVPSS